MKPGDIIVYIERAAILGEDKVRRATYHGTGSEMGVWPRNRPDDLVCSRDGEFFYIRPHDVKRVEEPQHGWTGTPAESGAW